MPSQAARDVHDAALLIDLHCDLLLSSWFTRVRWDRRHSNPLPGAPLLGHTDIPRFREGNVGCLALGVVTSPLRRSGGLRAIEADFSRFERMLRAHPRDLALARSPAEIAAARQQGRIGCFLGLEGVHGLGGTLEPLPALRDRGLGYVGLVHFSRNAAAQPMVGWGAGNGGLTDYGRALVDELGRLGIVVDVAHLNKAGLLEVCARTTVPVICSHSACTAVYDTPRGLDDEQIEAIAGTGGVVGVIFVTFIAGPGGVTQVADHLDHIKALVGIEHCAIGTDFDGLALYPRDLDGADKLPALTEELLRRGWTEDEVHQTYGGNFLRVMDAVQAEARA